VKKRIQNLMEQLCEEELDKLLSQHPEYCRCETCQTNVLTHALNHLPPRYADTELGRALVSVEGSYEQVRAKVTVALLKALELVKKSPHH
jgi:competence protein ComFB